MNDKDFISYEYMTKIIKEEDLIRVIDMYDNFGWELQSQKINHTNKAVVAFKRDRKINHKNELNRLEGEALELLNTLNKLSKAKTETAFIFSLILGILVLLMFGGGLSLFLISLNNIGAIVAGGVLVFVSLILGFVNYLIYKKIVDKKTEKILPIIDEYEEKFSNVLERGNALLKNDEI